MLNFQVVGKSTQRVGQLGEAASPAANAHVGEAASQAASYPRSFPLQKPDRPEHTKKTTLIIISVVSVSGRFPFLKKRI